MQTKQYERTFARLRDHAWAHPLTGHGAQPAAVQQIADYHNAVLDRGMLRVALTLNR